MVNWKDKEEVKEYQKQYGKKNRIKLREYHRKWSGKNRDKVRGYSKENPEVKRNNAKRYAKNNPKKIKAHNTINNMIKRKEIQPPTFYDCVRCNEQAEEYHHPNYNFPKIVIPSCGECHKIIGE